MAKAKVHWTRAIDPRSWEFILAILAMLMLFTLTILGKDDNKEIISALSAIMGAGFWGGVKAAVARTEKPPEKDGLE